MDENIRLMASAAEAPAADPAAQATAAQPTEAAADEATAIVEEAQKDVNTMSGTVISQTAGQPNQNVEPAKQGSGGLLWIILLVVAAVATAGAVFFLKKRPKAAPIQETQPDPIQTKPISDEDEEPVPPVTSMSLYEIGYAQTIGARENQEDAFGFVYPKPLPGQTEKLLAVVCDGMGGLDDGQIASNTAVKVLTSGFEEELRAGTPQSCLLNLCAKAQAAVQGHNRKTGSNTGCTLVSILIKDGRLSFLSVGDSRISLYRGRSLLQLNREHVLGHEMDEKQAFQGTGLSDPVRRRAITSHIGKETFSKVDRNINPFQLLHGDKILLMSDGLFGALSEDEILRELSLPAQQAANRLVQAVTAKGMPGQDNATVVIVSYP